jgi:uncharacterized membrane protein/mono/diheme cytochrome c family protein
MVGGLLILLNFDGQLHLRPTFALAQAETSAPRLRQDSRGGRVGSPSNKGAAGERFQQLCVKCHGKDGKGSEGRQLLPDIPDFTSESWQERRSDEQLLTSVIKGKGQDMPPFNGKINKDQARDLVAHVRSFARNQGKPTSQKMTQPVALKNWGEEFRRLEKQLDALKVEFRDCTQGSDNRARDISGQQYRGAENRQLRYPQPDTMSAEPPRCPSGPLIGWLGSIHTPVVHFPIALLRAAAVEELSRLPTGQPAFPAIFCYMIWFDTGVARHEEACATSGVFEMDTPCQSVPPDCQRGSTSQDSISKGGNFRSAEEGQIEPPIEPEETESPRSPFQQLIAWVGRFHSPVVHFPIALLTAAALAELLRLVTGQPVFNAVSRFCIWIGAVTAVGAGILGWCWAGFHLADSSVYMMTHRWLGTSTAACAALLLFLAELGRRPHRPRTLMCFRVTLLIAVGLVLVTGFFGGVVVFGLDHYSLPPELHLTLPGVVPFCFRA